MLEAAELYDTAAAAIGDCTLVFAATARAHDQAKPVAGPDEAVRLMAPRVAAGESVAVLFGRERYGLEGHEVGLADRIVTFPVNPAFASLNLSQAVLVMAYEWFKLTGEGLPFAMPQKSPPATKQQLLAFFANLERELDKALEDTFPASDPIAIDSADVHEERRRKVRQDSGSPFPPRSAVSK